MRKYKIGILGVMMALVMAFSVAPINASMLEVLQQKKQQEEAQKALEAQQKALEVQQKKVAEMKAAVATVNKGLVDELNGLVNDLKALYPAVPLQNARVDDEKTVEASLKSIKNNLNAIRQAEQRSAFEMQRPAGVYRIVLPHNVPNMSVNEYLVGMRKALEDVAALNPQAKGAVNQELNKYNLHIP